VRSGLIPALQSGFMVGASSTWRMAILRPGEDPIGHLASALGSRRVLGADNDELASTADVLIEATVRRSATGLVNAVRQARIPKDENILVLVDQFEELFRFRRSRHAGSRDDAMAFVRLLIEAAHQRETPVYVVLTMRSDFIGDCMDFDDLADAVNAGLFLVGRMSRDALRTAITGPVAVGGGRIAPRLVHRVLNDLGDDHDQLPLVQHALMRTWDQWERTRKGDAPIDVRDYEAVGTFRNALSMHAEEAYQQACAGGRERLVEQLFKALTDTFSDPRGVRRPTSIGELSSITGCAERDVVSVVDLFRQKGRSFLMPPPSVPLATASIVDLSHESLMRCWSRLITWADEERESAEFYVRLSRAAGWFDKGSAGLWRNPELEFAQQWKEENQPTPAWAGRYDESFEKAIKFLERSLDERAREDAERERARKTALRRVEWTASVLAAFLVAAVLLTYYARRANERAEANLALAREAVDESLSSSDRDPTLTGSDVPQVEEFRRELLTKAERFYRAFMTQDPRGEIARRDFAFSHFRLGHINRLLEKGDEAIREYQSAIEGFDVLRRSYPAKPEYRSGLANAYNYVGLTLLTVPARSAEAERAYDSAYDLQVALTTENPSNEQYREELARTHYNRGILRASKSDQFDKAESDFREAVRILEPIAPANDRAAQGLARAYNNLGSLLASDTTRADAVRALWEQAIAINERLAIKDPGNRQYKMELAIYCNNLAALLNDRDQYFEAERRSREAVDLLEALARTAPSLAIARADAHSLRGMIVAEDDAQGAEREYTAALDLFEQMHGDQNLRRLPDFHLRFGDLLLNLARFPGRPADVARARQLLARAVTVYADMATRIVASGNRNDAQIAVDNLSRILPQLPEPERTTLTASYEQLQHKLDEGAVRR
jgi:Novel STAND NTPase 1